MFKQTFLSHSENKKAPISSETTTVLQAVISVASDGTCMFCSLQPDKENPVFMGLVDRQYPNM